MDPRGDSGEMIKTAMEARWGKSERLELLLTAALRAIQAVDQEVVKLRKELRTRNGGENA